MRSVNQGKSWSDKRIRSFIHKQEKLFWKEGYCCWVVEDKIKRNFVGSCGVEVFDPPGCLDLGCWVAKIYWTRFCNINRMLCFETHFQENSVYSLKISCKSGKQVLLCCDAQDRFST